MVKKKDIAHTNRTPKKSKVMEIKRAIKEVLDDRFDF